MALTDPLFLCAFIFFRLSVFGTSAVHICKGATKDPIDGDYEIAANHIDKRGGNKAEGSLFEPSSELDYITFFSKLLKRLDPNIMKARHHCPL